MSENVVKSRSFSEGKSEADSSNNVNSSNSERAERRQERDTDLLYGQPVIVTARWIFVVSALILAFWNAETVESLKLQVLVIFLLAVENFYVHAQLLTGKPVKSLVVYLSSAADLLLISILILFQGGFNSSLYVFYFPAIAALSVAFSTQRTAEYTAGAISAYATVCLMGGGDILITISRALMIGAVAFCGNRYWQIERARRREAATTREELLAELQQQNSVVSY
jgi:hypothetical protein